MTTVPALLERPLSARSVMASLLLGMHPPRARGSLLVRWCGLFGVAAGTARVALHRMTAHGELDAHDGVYELAGRLRDRQREQDRSIRPEVRAWAGDWAMAIVTTESLPASERQALRRAMTARRFAELRVGVWTRPDNLTDDALVGGRAVDRRCARWRGRPDEDDERLAATLFAPDLWSRRARQLLDRIVVSTRRLEEGEEGLVAEAFLVGAAALRHVRADPLLPPVLLPDRWPGDELRAAYVDYREAFQVAARAWFSATGG